MFVSAGTDLKFHNYPVEDYDLIYKPFQQSYVQSLSWSKDNCYLTFVSENAKPEIISLKDINNIKNVHTITGISGASTVCFQKTTKRYIGIGTYSGQAALYDTKNKVINKLYEAATGPINFLDFNVNDKQMAISCTNGSILLYDTKKTQIREIYNISNTSHSTTMQFHPKEQHLLAVGTDDGALTQWDVNVGQNIFGVQIHTAPVTGLALIENENVFISVGSDHKFSIHDMNMGESVFRSNLPYPLTAVDVSPNKHLCAVGNIFGNIYVYDMRQLMEPVLVIKPHNTKINKITFENKMAHNANDNFSQVNSVTCYPMHETMIKCENKSVNQMAESNMNKNEIAGSTNIYNPNCAGENIICTSTSCREQKSESASAESLKQEVANSIYKYTEELRTHLMQQISGLHEVIKSEFHALENQMEEKWDILNSVITAKELSKD